MLFKSISFFPGLLCVCKCHDGKQVHPSHLKWSHNVQLQSCFRLNLNTNLIISCVQAPYDGTRAFMVANAHWMFFRSLWRHCPAVHAFATFYDRNVKKQKPGLHLPFLPCESTRMCVCGDGSCLCTEQTDRGAFSWNHKVVKRSMPWPVTCDCKFLCSCYVFQGSWSLTVYLVEEEERSPLYCWAADESLPCPGSWRWHRAVPQVLLWWTVLPTPREQQGWWQPSLTWLWLKKNLWSLPKWDPALPFRCFHCVSDGGWALLQTNCLQCPAEGNNWALAVTGLH